jgi:putative transcriptional regulator
MIGLAGEHGVCVCGVYGAGGDDAGDVPEADVTSRIRNTIRDLRATAGMTQQQLADKIGLTRQTVIAIEGDKYSPSLETAFRIALGRLWSRCFSMRRWCARCDA